MFWSKLVQCCWTAQISKFTWDFLKMYNISHWNGLIHGIVNTCNKNEPLDIFLVSTVVTLETREKEEESG